MDIIVVILRLLHVVSATYWVGAGVMAAFFVEPAAAAAGPAGGQFLLRLGQGKFGLSMTIAAILTVVGGFLLYWRFGYSLNSITGTVLLAGGIAGLAAMIYGGAVTGPATGAIGRLGKEIQSGGKPPTPAQATQLAALTARIAQASRVSAVLTIVAVIAMAAARYL